MKRSSNVMASAFALLEIIRDKNGVPIDYRFMEVNPDFEIITGGVASDIVGRTVKEAFPNAEERWVHDCGHVAESGESMEIEEYFDALDKYFRAYVFRPSPDQLAVFFSDITERTRTEQRLSLTQFAMDHHVDAAFWANEAGEFVYFNNAARKSLGYSEEELLDMTVWDIDSNVTPASWQDTFAECKSGRDFSVRSHHRSKDGSLFPVEIHGHYIEFAHSQLVCGLVHNITERERSEQAILEIKKRYDIATSAAKLGVWETDIATGRLKWNDQMREIYGLPEGDAIPDFKHWLNQFVHPDDRAYVETKQIEAETISESLEAEFRIIRGDGAVRHIRTFCSALNDSSGSPAQLIGINQDITEEREAELNHIETASFLDSIIDQSPVPMWVADLDGTIIRTNKALCSTLELESSQLIGQYNILQDKNLQKDGLLDKVKSVFEQKETVHLSTRWEAEHAGNPDWSNGRDLYVEATVIPVINSAGNLTHIVCQWIDNTKRKEAEKALRESESSYRLLFDNMTAGFALHEMIRDDDGNPVDYRFLQVNPAFEELTGISVSKAIGRTVKELMPNTETLWIDSYGRVEETGDPCSFQSYSQELGKYFEVRAFRPAPGQFATIFVDVSERILTNRSLKESEERFNIAADAAIIGIWEFDIQKELLVWDHRMFQLYGVVPEEFTGAYDTWHGGLHPEDRQRALDEVTAAASGEKEFNTEFRIIRPEGEIRHIRAYSKVICDENGTPLRMIGTNQDITERKQMEEELTKSRDLLNESQTAGHIGSWEYYIADDVIRWSDEMYHIVGIEVGAPLPGWEKMYDSFPQDWERLNTAVQGAIAGTPYDEDFRILRPDGTIRWGRVQGTPVKDENGNIVRLIGTTQDITERKQAEVELKESEERFRSTINDLQVGVAVHAPDTRMLLCNPAAADMLGVDIEKAIGKTNTDPAWTFVRKDLSIMPVEEYPVNRVLAAGKTVSNQIFGIMRSDRETPLWCNSTAVPIFDDENHIKHIIVNFADISEIKQFEADLLERKNTLKSTLDGLSAHIALLDEEGTILLVNQRWRDFAEQNGMPKNAGIEGANYLSACEHVSGEEADQVSEFTKGIKDVLAGRKTLFTMEYPCHSENEQRWFLVSCTLFPGDGPHRVVVAHENITARKLAEDQLIAQNNSLERFNKVAVGRELRMIELKKEINALCRALGKPEPYKPGGGHNEKE